MVTASEQKQIFALNQRLSHNITIGLIDSEHQNSKAFQGDILYIFGEIGDRRAVSWLETVLGGEFDFEVKEAVKEALEKLIH